MENLTQKQKTKGEEALIERFAELFPDMEKDALQEGFDALCQSYPELDLNELCTDAVFAAFAAGRAEALDVIYEKYLELVKLIEKEVERQVRARTQRATGSSSRQTGAPRAGLSEAQAAMLAEWNRAYPEYAMNSREYAAMLKNV